MKPGAATAGGGELLCFLLGLDFDNYQTVQSFLGLVEIFAKIIDKKGHRNEAEKLFQSVIIQDSKRTSEPLNEYGIFLTNHKRYPDAIRNRF